MKARLVNFHCIIGIELLTGKHIYLTSYITICIRAIEIKKGSSIYLAEFN